MTIKVGINGFGRIGRCTLSHIAASGRDDIEVVRINATGPLETAAHLIKYDSVHGRFGGNVAIEGDTMDLGRGPIKVQSTYDPQELDWDGVDVVLECTGKFNDGTKASVEQMATDVAAFLTWAGEPKMEQRKSMGFQVVLYLIILSILLFLTKKRVWGREPH